MTGKLKESKKKKYKEGRKEFCLCLTPHQLLVGLFRGLPVPIPILGFLYWSIPRTDSILPTTSSHPIPDNVAISSGLTEKNGYNRTVIR